MNNGSLGQKPRNISPKKFRRLRNLRNLTDSFDTYCIGDFRKGRHQQVKSQIKSLKILILSLPMNSLKRKSLVLRLNSVRYFDNRPTRVFLKKYLQFILLTLGVDVRREMDFLVSQWEHECMCKGPTETLGLFKKLYGIGCRFVTSNVYEPLNFRKSNKEGFPILLGPLKYLLTGSLNERRSALSILSVFKLIESHTGSLSIQTILKESPIEQITFDLKPKVGSYLLRYIEQKGRHVGPVDLHLLRRCYFSVLEKTFPSTHESNRLQDISELSDLHISGRSGPNGPALNTVVIDHHAFQKDENSKHLRENLVKMATLTNNAQLLETLWTMNYEESLPENIRGTQAIHSKISVKLEPWGRKRPFAIVDYFSQSSLLGFHNYLFRWLADQPEDGTFDQDRVAEYVRNWTDQPGLDPQSADLSAATDSIPVEVQAEIVSQIAGSDFAHLWMNIVSNREFKTPTGEFVRYRSGQPMGIYSSFAMLAVWHHIMAKVSFAYLNMYRLPSGQPQYCIIGDDICMLRRETFRIYEVLVSTVQGVEISKTKGFHNDTQHLDNKLVLNVETLDSMTTAELAKRIFCNGQEITTIPPKEVFTSFTNPMQIPELTESLQTRGYRNFVNNRLGLFPAISEFSYRDSLALTLCTSPLQKRPLSEVELNIIKDDSRYSVVPWFRPEFNVDVFNQRLIYHIMSYSGSLSDSTSELFHKWEVHIYQRDEIRVGNWIYVSDAQSELLGVIHVLCVQKYRKIFMDIINKYATETSLAAMLELKSAIRLIQTLFEVDTIFDDDSTSGIHDRKNFFSCFLGKVISETLKEINSVGFNNEEYLKKCSESLVLPEDILFSMRDYDDEVN